MTTILVIEDEDSVRSNMLEMLEAEGFAPLGAGGGKEGLSLARQHHPDLILCDVMMADLDGYEVLAGLQQQPDTATIPFVFVTAKTARGDWRQGMQLGADDYLTKPFTGKELLDVVTVRINKREQVNQLQSQLQEMEKLNLLKDDLISTVSHDLRTPLMNMKMAIEMLRVSQETEQRDKYLEILRNECLRETELVNNLLELQRLEDQGDRPPLDNIEIAPWLKTLVDRFQVRLDAVDHLLRLDLPQQLPTLCCDRNSLSRLMTELLNNACKYTPAGGHLQLSVSVLEQPGVGSRLRLRLGNEATIPPEALPKLFNKFYRVPAGDQRQQGGSGLGLALVKRLVDALQGEIAIASNQGWTTVTVDLPLSIEAEDSGPAQSPAQIPVQPNAPAQTFEAANTAEKPKSPADLALGSYAENLF